MSEIFTGGTEKIILQHNKTAYLVAYIKIHKYQVQSSNSLFKLIFSKFVLSSRISISYMTSNKTAPKFTEENLV